MRRRHNRYNMPYKRCSGWRKRKKHAGEILTNLTSPLFQAISTTPPFQLQAEKVRRWALSMTEKEVQSETHYLTLNAAK